MSCEIDDGGPVHPGQWVDFQPTTGDQVVREQWTGMSLRDWFAGMAMQGILSAADSDEFEYYDSIMKHSNWVPSTSYEIADAMIAARKGGAR